jgi:3-oxoacyl-[acyl-carrier protein] reductase
MNPKKVVLITAGTRGIGKRIALRFAEKKTTVALNYRSNREEAERSLAEVLKFSPASRLYPADVSHADKARRLIDSVVGDYGRIDILINNVGPMLVKPLYDTTAEEWDGMIRSNLGSAFYCSKYALKSMRERKSGQIVNIGCLHGEIAPGGLPNSPAYGIAKSAVLMMTKLFARSEAKYNIRVNAVNPGLVETEDYARYPEAVRETWKKQVPRKEFGAPDDIAEAILFLTSDAASYITGAVLPVHGGLWIPG